MPKKHELEYWGIHPDYADAMIEAWGNLKMTLQQRTSSTDLKNLGSYSDKSNITSYQKGTAAYSEKILNDFFVECVPQIKEWFNKKAAEAEQ